MSTMQPILELSDCVAPLLKGRRILLGITGSVAAYKALPLIRLLRKSGAEVRVVITKAGQKFVTPVSVEALSDSPAYTSAWTPPKGHKSANHQLHIELARWAEMMVIAPASAGFLARAAHGLAQDLLSTELLAFNGPVLLAPAMNPSMYRHPATQRNIGLLKDFGHQVMSPKHGDTACGEIGVGRLPEPEEILVEVASCLRPKLPNHFPRVGISLGATRSAIDPVRYLTNHSSGIMGVALAWAAWRSGREVTLLKGFIDPRLPLPPCKQIFDVCTADEMFLAAKEVWPHHLDFWIASAAVLDWDIKNPANTKIKKDKAEAPQLQWKLNPDILAYVGSCKRPDQRILGFAAETEFDLKKVQNKLKSKNCDAIFCNLVGNVASGNGPNAFGNIENEGFWIQPENHWNAPRVVKRAPKLELAQQLIQWTLTE